MNPLVWLVAAATSVGHLATAGIYGYHRDEFYYLACGRRLAWGFVDHPPLTPLLYRVSQRVLGTSPLDLRVIPALVHGALVVVVALLARELGGDRRAQFVAALGAALAPVFLTTGHFLGTVTLDVLTGAVAALVLVRLINGGSPLLWLALGAVIGIGMLNKWTTGLLVVGLLVGLLATPQRSVLLTPWVVAGAVLAAALVAPNVVWQARHGWPQLEFASELRDYGEGLLTVPSQFVLLGVVCVLAVPGMLWLFRAGPGRTYRSLGIAFVVVLALVLLTGGKPYYASALTPALIAAGAVAVSTTWTSWTLPALLLAGGLLLAPFATPLLPLSTANAIRTLNPEIGEMTGWEHLVDVVAEVHAAQPHATILTSNYSEAGSIELLGSPRGMPQPVSGHLTYAMWDRPDGRSDVTLAVGFSRAYLETMFTDVREATIFRTPGGIENMENGAIIWLCRGQRADWDQLGPRIRHY